MKSLVILIAAVCIGVAVGDMYNSKELQKKWPLIEALKLLHPMHGLRLATRSVIQPRQAVFGTCTIDDVLAFSLSGAVPTDCNEDLIAVAGDDLFGENGFFTDVLNLNPATVTAVYRILCQPRCGNPLVRFVSECGLNANADAARYLCSTNGAGSRCYEGFNPLLPDANAVVSSCLPASASCSFFCENALTTLRVDSGCCVNFFNDSTVFATEPLLLSALEYDLWDNCDVATPDFCNLDTSTLSGAMAVTLSKILFVGLLFAVVVFIP